MRTRRPRYGRLIAYFCISIVFGSIAGLSVSKFRLNLTNKQEEFIDGLGSVRMGSARSSARHAGSKLSRAERTRLFSALGLPSESADELDSLEGRRTAGTDETASEQYTAIHRVKSGETLAGMFKQHGVECGVAASVIQTLSSQDKGQITIRSGETFKLTFDGSSDLQRLERVRSDGSSLIVARTGTGSFKGEIHTPQIREHVRRVAGVIQHSLAATADDLEIPFDVVDEVVDHFGGRIRFDKDLHPGDRFAVVYTERRLDDGRLVGVGPVQAALLVQDGVPHAIIRHVDGNGKEFYFDQSGKTQGESFLRYPVQFTRISSMFSKARFHPVLNVHKPHNGVDFAAPTGTPVRSIGEGAVTFAGYSKTGGYTVKIQHNERYSTEYLHLSKIDRSVKKGCQVARGQLIGAVGTTGRSTGPHLHFGLFDRGVYRDPLSVDFGEFDEPSFQLPKQVLASTMQELVSLTGAGAGVVTVADVVPATRVDKRQAA